ncbi:MAG: 3-methyl-2-oxobutanoate hydroxymethyltransferase [Candidatus Omnitrophica bacterium]|nr:3-methyl-2-oxobutanoate hydroxymethyltransferase [Candidatus Omnitrophota bacterium]
MTNSKITVLDFKRKKEKRSKISMLTAYDYPMARLIDSAGVDAVLVGDSVGMVMLGYDSTIYVTMDEMIHHAKAVRKGVKNAFLIGDMPFMSYQASDEDAIRNAGRFVKEAGCEAVKVEGGMDVVSRVKAILFSGIPVLGHLGLTPQSVNKIGGYKVQGKDAASAAKLIDDAVELEKAGCFGVVLECIPANLAKRIQNKLSIPTIGIGAGVHCDGQVLVTHDIIGYFDKFVPKFTKRYADVGTIVSKAIEDFKTDVESGSFPDEDHSF